MEKNEVKFQIYEFETKNEGMEKQGLGLSFRGHFEGANVSYFKGELVSSGAL